MAKAKKSAVSAAEVQKGLNRALKERGLLPRKRKAATKSQEMVTVQRVAGGSLHDARVVPPAPDRRPEPLTTVTPEGAEEAMTARLWGAGRRTIDGVGVKGRRVRAKGTRQREQRALAKREVPRKVQRNVRK